MKALSEMTLEELWQLFPIVLTPHQVEWAAQYAREAARIAAFMPTEDMARISHIGSTAIAGIWAKPIVDILLEVPETTAFAQLRRVMTENGYICMNQSEKRMSFNRGYTPAGFEEEVFHLHVRRAGDCDELYFRDYLNEFPETAQAYEQMKLDLWKRFEHIAMRIREKKRRLSRNIRSGRRRCIKGGIEVCAHIKQIRASQIV